MKTKNRNVDFNQRRFPSVYLHFKELHTLIDQNRAEKEKRYVKWKIRIENTFIYVVCTHTNTVHIQSNHYSIVLRLDRSRANCILATMNTFPPTNAQP